jgi:hypothetical protein
VIPDILRDTNYRERELQATVIEDRLAEWTPLAEIKFRHTLVDNRDARRVSGIRISEGKCQDSGHGGATSMGIRYPEVADHCS